MNNSNLYDVWENIVKKAVNECDSDNQNIYVPYGSCKFGMTFISTNRLKNKSLYIEIDPAYAKSYKLPQIQGLNFEFISVPAIDNSKLYLKIYLVNTNVMDEAFEAFTVSVLNQIQDLITTSDVLDTISQVVYDYEQFFGSEKEKRLTKQEEQGLFGELTFLKSLIQKKGEDFVTTWTGPQKNKHDFISPTNVGVEIKTISSQTQKNISISNENQLKYEDRKELFLKLYVLEANPNGRTICDLIDDIKSLIVSSKNNKVFKEKILEFGIIPEAYRARYSFVEVTNFVYKIDSTFPRIRKEDISNCIFEVKYKVNVDQINVYGGDVYEKL